MTKKNGKAETVQPTTRNFDVAQVAGELVSANNGDSGEGGWISRVHGVLDGYNLTGRVKDGTSWVSAHAADLKAVTDALADGDKSVRSRANSVALFTAQELDTIIKGVRAGGTRNMIVPNVVAKALTAIKADGYSAKAIRDVPKKTADADRKEREEKTKASKELAARRKDAPHEVEAEKIEAEAAALPEAYKTRDSAIREAAAKVAAAQQELAAAIREHGAPKPKPEKAATAKVEAAQDAGAEAAGEDFASILSAARAGDKNAKAQLLQFIL